MTTLQRTLFFVAAFVMAWPVVFVIWLNVVILSDLVAGKVFYFSL